MYYYNMILDEEASSGNLKWEGTLSNKVWVSVGDGKEVLVQQNSNKNKESSEEILINKEQQITLKPGDLVWHLAQWMSVTGVANDIATIKTQEKSIELPISECKTKIRIQILICTTTLMYLHITSVNPDDTLAKLGKKMSKKFSTRIIKAEWYYNGKVCTVNDTIESIGIKDDDKIICGLFGYDIKTFKRFKEIEQGRGWFMSHTSADAISFIPSKNIGLFGFGMYNTLSGPGTYTIKYEIFLDDEAKLDNTAVISRASESEQISKVYFNDYEEPMIVSSGTKITVSLVYPTYESESRLQVGHHGNEYANVEGNEPGLFTVEDTSRSHNGTGLSSGQIPEIYYCLLND